MTVKPGSKWWAGDNKRFRVLDVVEADGNVWVHYREDHGLTVPANVKEYSCYKESFVQRFRPLPE